MAAVIRRVYVFVGFEWSWRWENGDTSGLLFAA